MGAEHVVVGGELVLGPKVITLVCYVQGED